MEEVPADEFDDGGDETNIVYNGGMRKKNYKIFFVVCSVILMLGVVAVWLNFGVIKDVLVGMGYRPTSEMVEIREALKLTGTGARIFNASMPVLQEKQEFNSNCREVENESAILGCYRDERIFVYNIVDEELPGIRELTAAHELLHAVYSRMNSEDKDKWRNDLIAVYQENQGILGEEIDLYDDSEKQEELYVRVGTEIADLPDGLEKHYAEIFEDQDKIAGYYNSYIKVFREIEAKLEDLYGKITGLDEKIVAKTSEYEASLEALNGEIAEFNNCAATANCFSSVYVFNRRRAELLGKKEALDGLYDEISALIDQYNELIEEYNEYALHGQTLNMAINSSEKVEGI
ncbi:hypothetical protein IJG27_02960 [Candidatus Saccharibacteria bacterium]|nr:hypothetical protein [Candidatus Saccharibacteria bacterium]